MHGHFRHSRTKIESKYAYFLRKKSQSDSPKFSLFLHWQILRLNTESNFRNRKFRYQKIDIHAFRNPKIENMNSVVLKFQN